MLYMEAAAWNVPIKEQQLKIPGDGLSCNIKQHREAGWQVWASWHASGTVTAGAEVGGKWKGFFCFPYLHPARQPVVQEVNS